MGQYGLKAQPYNIGSRARPPGKGLGEGRTQPGLGSRDERHAVRVAPPFAFAQACHRDDIVKL